MAVAELGHAEEKCGNGEGGEEVERITEMTTWWRMGGRVGAFRRSRENAHGGLRLGRTLRRESPGLADRGPFLSRCC